MRSKKQTDLKSGAFPLRQGKFARNKFARHNANKKRKKIQSNWPNATSWLRLNKIEIAINAREKCNTIDWRSVDLNAIRCSTHTNVRFQFSKCLIALATVRMVHSRKMHKYHENVTNEAKWTKQQQKKKKKNEHETAWRRCDVCTINKHECGDTNTHMQTPFAQSIRTLICSLKPTDSRTQRHAVTRTHEHSALQWYWISSTVWLCERAQRSSNQRAAFTWRWCHNRPIKWLEYDVIEYF